MASVARRRRSCTFFFFDLSHIFMITASASHFNFNLTIADCNCLSWLQPACSRASLDRPIARS